MVTSLLWKIVAIRPLLARSSIVNAEGLDRQKKNGISKIQHTDSTFLKTPVLLLTVHTHIHILPIRARYSHWSSVS